MNKLKELVLEVLLDDMRSRHAGRCRITENCAGIVYRGIAFIPS